MQAFFFNLSKLKQMGNSLQSKTDYKKICYDHHIDFVQIIECLHTINPKALYKVK